MKKRRDKKEAESEWEITSKAIFNQGAPPKHGFVVVRIAHGFPIGVMTIAAVSGKHLDKLGDALENLRTESWRESEKQPCRVCGERQA
jgi:hypothetical protein